MRAGRRYALARQHVAQVVPCADPAPIDAAVMLATLEGLPALVVEPETVLGPRAAGAALASVASAASTAPDAPTLAVVIGQRGVLRCALAADKADFFDTQPADHVLSGEQISEFLDSL